MCSFIGPFTGTSYQPVGSPPCTEESEEEECIQQIDESD